MEITTKIAIGIMMVLGGGMGFLVAGNTNCDQAKNISYCKDSISLVFWSGQGISITGAVFVFLVLKFTKGDKENQTQSRSTYPYTESLDDSKTPIRLNKKQKVGSVE